MSKKRYTQKRLRAQRHVPLPGSFAVARGANTIPPDLAAVHADDARWFGDHPGRQFRTRWTTQAELNDFDRRGIVTAVMRERPGSVPAVMHTPIFTVGRDPASFNDDEAFAVFAASLGCRAAI